MSPRVLAIRGPGRSGGPGLDLQASGPIEMTTKYLSLLALSDSGWRGPAAPAVQNFR